MLIIQYTGKRNPSFLQNKTVNDSVKIVKKLYFIGGKLHSKAVNPTAFSDELTRYARVFDIHHKTLLGKRKAT